MAERFAYRLQRLRQEAGLSQTQRADAARCPVSSLRNWEQGRRLPQLDAAVLLAEVLGVSLDQLAGKGEDMLPAAGEPTAPRSRGRPRKVEQAKEPTPALPVEEPAKKTRRKKEG